MFRNTDTGYGVVSRMFHWIISLTIFTMLIVGYYMTSQPAIDTKYALYPIHKATGVTVLTAVIIRLLWRMRNTIPLLPEGTPRWQVIAAELNTKVLYFFMLAMPSSGISMTLYGGRNIDLFGLFTIQAFEKNKKISSLAAELHDAFAVLFILSISLHILAALYHHFIRKDNVLIRMIKG